MRDWECKIVSGYWEDNIYESYPKIQQLLKYGPLETMDDETKANMRTLINHAALSISERRRKILQLRYTKGMTYEAIRFHIKNANNIGHLSYSRTQQLADQALRQLVVFLYRELNPVLEGDYDNRNSLQTLKLSIRAYNAIIRSGRQSISDLLNITYQQLVGLRNVGTATTAEIVETIRKIDELHPCVLEYDADQSLRNKRMKRQYAIKFVLDEENTRTITIGGRSYSECYAIIDSMEDALGKRDPAKDICGYINDMDRFIPNKKK